ncbi:MAG: hypothetical protein AAB197_04890, partial [Deltaproteobacteria bacterium]
KMAAGLTIRMENIKLFESAFYNLTEKNLSLEDLVPLISLDSYIALDELNEKMVQEMESLAPFGMANTEPLLGARDASIVQSKVVGNNHLKLKIKQNSSWLMADSKNHEPPDMSYQLRAMSQKTWDGIAYRMGQIHPLKGNNFDIAFIPYIDEWNGNRNLKLKVKEIKSTQNSNVKTQN